MPEPYTPDDNHMMHAFIGYTSAPVDSLSDEGLLSEGEARARWDQWIAAHDARIRVEARNEAAAAVWDGSYLAERDARVARDAARGALTAFADSMAPAAGFMDQISYHDAHASVQARKYRDRFHPEETP